jgi:hypothetical protein
VKNLPTSGVAFGKKGGKLPVVMNVKCCSCLFYTFSLLSMVKMEEKWMISGEGEQTIKEQHCLENIK